MAQVIQADKIVNAEEGDLRVWWVRNPPSPADYHIVNSPQEAVEIINRLAEIDLKQPSVAINMCGLEVFEDDEWNEWYDEEGDNINGIKYMP